MSNQHTRAAPSDITRSTFRGCNCYGPLVATASFLRLSFDATMILYPLSRTRLSFLEASLHRSRNRLIWLSVSNTRALFIRSSWITGHQRTLNQFPWITALLVVSLLHPFREENRSPLTFSPIENSRLHSRGSYGREVAGTAEKWKAGFAARTTG